MKASTSRRIITDSSTVSFLDCRCVGRDSISCISGVCTGRSSLSTRASILMFSACDKASSCLASGTVSFSSQFDMVCLVTPTAAPSCSCESRSCFLAFRILFPHFMLTPFIENYTVLRFSIPAKIFGTLSKIFNITPITGIE